MKTLRIVAIAGLALTLAGHAVAAETKSQKPASTQEVTTTTETSKVKGHEGSKGWIELQSTYP